MSSTVAKALSLLDIFSEHEPEMGLSDIARRARVDKATAHRMLAVLAESGLLEQRPDTRAYRLGAGLLRLARIREAAFPVSAEIQAALDGLTRDTGETAHASLITGMRLATVGVSDGQRATRATIEAGEALPFHCTASGVVVLAFASPDLLDRVVAAPLTRHARHSPTEPGALRAAVERARAQGFAVADQTYEDEVCGIAAPLFDAGGQACGALAVATPNHRMSPALRQQIAAAVVAAAMRTTERTGGKLPETYRAAIAA
ncbi:MAG: IclR family transcriptional regulator [Paracoccaceae bacterium]|nr:MAG: IclR family transcriptional regulator [Paracoccaceae bacterium]